MIFFKKQAYDELLHYQMSDESKSEAKSATYDSDLGYRTLKVFFFDFVMNFNIWKRLLDGRLWMGLNTGLPETLGDKTGLLWDICI